MANDNPFIWQELVTTDQEKSGAFFSQLLGWELKAVSSGEFGTYTLFQIAGKDIAGMMNPTPDTPGEGSYWHSYIAVDDVYSCAEKTSELGGKVLVAPHIVPGVGRMRVVADPACWITDLIQQTEKQNTKEYNGNSHKNIILKAGTVSMHVANTLNYGIRNDYED